MNWRKRSVVKEIASILEAHFEPDPSSSLMISLHGTGPDGGPEDEMYLDMYYRIFPPRPGITFGPIDLGEGFVVALREAINALSLPGYVRVEEIDDNTWRLGCLHGMRRRKEEKPFTDRCMDAFKRTVDHFISVGIEGFINLHFLVVGIVSVIAAAVQNDVLTAITPVVLSLAIVENKDWRSLQKQRLARLVHRKEEWRERELDYRKRLRDECIDPDKWVSTKLFVQIRIYYLILGKVMDRYNEWRATRRPEIRLARMSDRNNSPSP